MADEIIKEMSKVLCMDEKCTIEFLERVKEAKDKINELTGIAQTDETYKSLSKCYDELDALLSPICPDCKVRGKRFITSPARLYDQAMSELPGGTMTFWTGEWYCPKCRHTIASGDKWWEKARIEEGAKA